MVKKYAILFGITLAAIGGILLAGFTSRRQPVPVTLYELTPQTVELSVICDGVVKAENSYDVYAQYSCVAAHVAVRPGDTVKAGDTLVTVDAQETRRLLSQTGRYTEAVIAAAAEQTVTAPVDGVVTAVTIGDGGAVDSGKPCICLDGTASLEIRTEIPEQELHDVFVGQEAVITGSGFAEESYSGRVKKIAAAAHISGGETVVDAVVTVDPFALDESLRLGLSAEVKLITSRLSQRLVVPYEAVQEDADNREFVYVTENGCAVRRTITTEADLSEGVLIGSGLSGAEQLIADAAAIPEEGMEVVEKVTR